MIGKAQVDDGWLAPFCVYEGLVGDAVGVLDVVVGRLILIWQTVGKVKNSGNRMYLGYHY